VSLPAIQLELFDAVAKACADDHNKPLVVVVMAGGPVDLAPFKSDPRVSALLWVGYVASIRLTWPERRMPSTSRGLAHVCKQ
jgi:hypothetical protein